MSLVDRGADRGADRRGLGLACLSLVDRGADRGGLGLACLSLVDRGADHGADHGGLGLACLSLVGGMLFGVSGLLLLLLLTFNTVGGVPP